MKKSVTTVGLALVCLAVAAQGLACGRERWPVKVGDDPDAHAVDLAHPVTTTIAALDQLPAPAVRPQDARVTPVEDTVYRLTATVFAYKRESDGDYHLALRDHAGHTLIAEIPDPACVAARSPFKAAIESARAEFDAHFKAEKRFRRSAATVTLTGVGFFDFDHHQKGVAPNAIELHPVLAFSVASAPAAP